MYLQQRPEDIPPRLSSRVPTRIAVLAAVLAAALAMILFRLWSVQVLSGDHYRALARDNGIREIRVQAPRGEIVDRNGRVLVSNRTMLALELVPSELPDDRAARR